MVLGHDTLTKERTQDIKISEDVSFDSMLLSPNTLKGLKTSGFYAPSPIQLHGIPLGKCGFDLLLEAKSGTGKTAVFSIIALEKLNLEKGVQTLILAPTREIASQICDVIKTIGSNFKGLSVEVVMGGLPFAEDVEKFKKKVHIVVGSPGRLHHLISKKHIDISSVRLMVLDEADKLVEKSFLPDVNYIFSLLPSQKQIIMSSATYPESVKTIMSNYVQNAHHICPDSGSVLLGIEQNVTVVPSHVNIVTQTKNRYVELNQILSKKKFKQCLVFCNYQVRVGEVHRMLNKDKWPADKLYGQQQQTDRLEALKILQDYQCRILVTTDLTARGIDASNVDLVINFEIPYDWQTYLHRIGRAGRFGSYGSAITILCEGDEEKKFKTLLGSLNIPFNLKYLWSKEPFLLDNLKIDEESHKEGESQSKIKTPEKKLGIKETYEKLWTVLSDDSTQSKPEMHDIPTFENLCKSFEQVSRYSMIDNIENFLDLMSSFQNHEIKGNENIDYKTVKVNKMIIPCTIFNRNIVQKSFQKDESCINSLQTNQNNHVNKTEKINNSKLVHNEIDSKDNTRNICDSKLTKPRNDKKSGNVSKSGTEDDDTDSSIETSRHNIIKNKEEESKLNCDPSGSRCSQSETAHNNVYFSIASGSSEYKTKTGASSREKYNITSKKFDNVQVSNLKNSVLPKTDINNDAKSFDESDSSSYKSDYNDNASEHSFMSLKHNDEEKSLLAANLPTAFGKFKQNNSICLKKHRDTSSKKHLIENNKNKRNSDYQTRLPKIRTVLSKTNVKQGRVDTFYESTDGEKTDDESVSCRSLGGKTSSSHIPHPKKSRKCNSNHYGVNIQNTSRHINKSAEERQRQFDLWYKQLQAHMRIIEQSVYIAVMSNPHY